MKQLSLILLLCLSSLTVWAQQSIVVRGSVTDSANEPLIGATVQVVGTDNGTITDIDGNYSIRVGANQSLHFAYVGYGEQTIAVNGRTTINVKLVEGEELEEVVVIGYGTVKKSHLTGAVASISAADLQAGVQRSAASALQGRIAGVTVQTNTGQPGQGMTINVRGVNSLSSTAPLYVIDGVYGDINMIDPADIQNIEVLKDASAAAIYGSRAANGVILVTTKGGKKNTKTQVTVDAYAGVQMVSKKLDIMNGDEYVAFAKKYNIAQDQTGLTSWKGKGTDWQDEVFSSALISKVNLNVSGGGDNATYSVSGSYTKQDGIMKTTGYEGWNLRNKNTFSFFNNHVRMGNTFTIRMARTDWDDFETSSLTNILPMQKVYDYTLAAGLGHWGQTPSWGKPAGNPVGWLEARDNRRYNIDIMLNGWAEVDLFVKGLKYKLNVGLNKYLNRNYASIVPYEFSSQQKQSDTQLTEGTNWQNQWLIENTLHYDNTFGKHSLNVVLGYSAQENSLRGFGVQVNGMPDGVFALAAGATAQKPTSDIWRETSVSWFARAMWSYDNRYMLSASIRSDGNSKFAKGQKWGSFPSISAGWNIANEAFFESLRNTMNELKFRVGYGVLGNTNGIGRYATQSGVTQGYNGVWGNTWYMGSITNTSWVTPATTTWEQTQTWNFGLDMALYNNKLTLSADYYIADTKDLLLSIPQPSSFGLSGSPSLNAGNVRNSGFELALKWRDKVGDLNYHVGANLSTLSNKLNKVTIGGRTEWSGYDPHGGGTVTYSKLGYPIGGFWLIKTDGIFQSQSEIDNYKNKEGNLIQPNAVPGDLKFVDADGSGSINGDDRQFVGTALPKLSIGLNLGATWKGIDLNVFFDGQFGHKIYNALPYYNATQAGVTNFLSSVSNSWRSDNKNTDIPRFIGTTADPTTATDNNGTRWAYTDRWLESGDFFRLKTLELGYTLPATLVQKAKLQRVRIYTAMDNLFTITSYTGYTPDLGINTGFGATGSGADAIMSRGTDDGRYPVARTVTFGLQVTF
jgi:TonB-linked SusC/RagA family outer membrane protein